MKIIILGAYPASLVNFRGHLIKRLVESNHEVITMASEASEEEIRDLVQLGTVYISYPVQRNGLNPICDIKTAFSLVKIFRRIKPDVILAYTIKPVIYGAFASTLHRNCQFYGLITGLGFAFQKGGIKRNILSILVKWLYKIALVNANKVIFQNPDNLRAFTDSGIVSKNKSFLVNGSGVDLKYFTRKPLSKEVKFLLIARLLGDKGIVEYMEAASIVKRLYPNAEFDLVGPEDPSPDGIRREQIDKWHNQGVIQYHGSAKDVRSYLESCSIFVLPSYHEGMPRTVLEAMATGRPILTTDVPGCRETVVNGENGWLVEKGSSQQLAEKMIWFIEHQEKWQDMSDASYQIVQDKFDVNIVNRELISILTPTLNIDN